MSIVWLAQAALLEDVELLLDAERGFVVMSNYSNI